MTFLRNYPLLSSFLFLVIMVTSSYFWTNIPSRAMFVGKPIIPDFRFLYLPDQVVSDEKALLEQTKATFFTTLDQRMDRDNYAMSTSFYPIFDEKSTLAQFKRMYPYLSQEEISGYGNSVYFVDYGNIRMFYLNAIKLAEKDSSQLTWLAEKTSNHEQSLQLVLLASDPEWPVFWQQMQEMGIHLVMIKNQIFISEVARDAMVGSKNLLPIAHAGWLLWESDDMDDGFFVMEGNMDQFSVRLQNRKDETLNQLTIGISDLVKSDQFEEHTLISMQSMWKYERGQDVIARVPGNGYDITGEHPITQPFDLPIDDWRHLNFEDQAWKLGEAPFGHTNNKRLETMINHWLPVDGGTSYVFRKAFELPHAPDEIKRMQLHIAFEDGFIAYLNGEELTSNHIHSGLTDYRTLAVPNEFQAYQTIDLSNQTDKLRPGKNVLAVQVHRSHPKSPNLLFDLSLTYRKEAKK